MKKRPRWVRPRRGGVSVETVLIISLIALPLLGGLIAFRSSIVSWFSSNSSNASQNQVNPIDHKTVGHNP